jgi:hypothetical protein
VNTVAPVLRCGKRSCYEILREGSCHKKIEDILVQQIHYIASLIRGRSTKQIEAKRSSLQGRHSVVKQLHYNHDFALLGFLNLEAAVAAVNVIRRHGAEYNPGGPYTERSRGVLGPRMFVDRD